MDWLGTIRRWCGTLWGRITIVLLAGLGIVWIWIPSRAGDPSRATRPFRVGFQQSLPHQIVTPDGKAAGPAIEIFAESARRRHIPIEWVHVPEGPEPGLRSGKVDLWPLLGDLPERRKFLYISDGWIGTTFWMVTLESSTIMTPRDTVGRRVGHGGINLDLRIATTNFKEADLVALPTSSDALAAVCRHDVEAGVIAGSVANSVLLRRLADCHNVPLRFALIPNGRVSFGVGASRLRPGADRAADAIHSGISGMAADGTLSSIYFKWLMDPNNEAMIIYYLIESQRRTRYMAGALGVLCVMFVLLVWQTLWLRAARRAADAANVAKSEFLANMSHEIRTPMNGVMGMTELAIASDSREEQLEYLSLVKSSSNALLTVVNDILDFSKIEAGKLLLDPVPFDLRDAIVHTLRPISMSAHEKGLEFAYEVADDVPDALIADPGRLRQILTNLASNALKFTEKGEVVLRVGAEPRVEQSVRLHFSIHDTGIGIPAEKQEEVFKAFSQADGSTTRRFGGTGLGLSICKNLVEMMGGRIWMESEPGRGTTVHFTAVFDVQAVVAPEIGDFKELAGRRVLVIDDNGTSRRILRTLLDEWRMMPTVTDSGPPGIAALEQCPFDLVMLDMQMPGMNGLEVAEQIGARRLGNCTRILGLNSPGSVGGPGSVAAPGVDAWLAKPIGPRDLLEAIHQLLAPATDQSTVADTTTAVPAEGAMPAEPVRKLDILVAEDNPVNQKVVRRMLERLGHTVEVVGDGRLAVNAFARRRFDLIFMDIQMPDVDGVSATAQIRDREALDEGARVPVIALTAHAMSGDRERFLKAGFDGYVSKPIQVTELAALIAGVCGESDYSDCPPGISGHTDALRA